MALFTKEDSVSKPAYDLVLARLARYEARYDALVATTAADMVARSLYEQALADRRRWERRYAKLVKIVADFKRHDVGMPPKDFDASAASAINSLGPRVQLAIDTMSAGSPELRSLLISRAVLLWSQEMSEPGASKESVDEYVANLIEDGDP